MGFGCISSWSLPVLSLLTLLNYFRLLHVLVASGIFFLMPSSVVFLKAYGVEIARWEKSALTGEYTQASFTVHLWLLCFADMSVSVTRRMIITLYRGPYLCIQ